MEKKPNPTTQSLNPENQKTPIYFSDDFITKEGLVFIRNHFDYPILYESMFTIPIEGEVEETFKITYEQIRNLPAKDLVVVLESSGSNRSNSTPKVFDEQWDDGTISQGKWKGVALYHLLNLAKLKDNVKEIVFVGHDFGKRTGLESEFHFARSLPLEKALHPDTIIAYEYNNKLIPYKLGYPLRLIVPGWYLMSSVKWIKRIIAIDYHFEGQFHAIDYNYYPNKDNDEGKTPVTTINVNSIIQEPLDHANMGTGDIRIKGIAWTGLGVIQLVQVSIDDGITWNQADIKQDKNEPYSWVEFSYLWKATEKGEYTIFSRAIDSFGRIQPLEPIWNRKGYGYNEVYKIKVNIE